ncbi:DUF4373 domain-containing protein [Listeria booriae]|uniref:DUF4373 domain-containing protein n=1 Tax=Listeria booriae TaxID=1552123 RepID=A0A842FAL6_9LIST|nr:DUF4373 domain-containing protein [Listeria booriae]MBC2241842.1 DUF4373 domain-containing protein [Listeria booriae]
MARPIKKGIDYFPLDVNFLSDIKVRKIMRACGSSSISILISLLSNIYRDEGYYVAWDDDTAFLVSDEVGANEGSVEEIVKKAIQVGFFDKALFDNEKILTSKGIQERYKTAAYKKKDSEILDKYSLMTRKSYDNGVSDDGNEVNTDESTQSKVKERKEKKNKEKAGAKSRQKKFDEVHLSLAKHLLRKILENNPESRSEKYLESWANTFRLMMEIDKRTVEQITYLIDWSQQDKFWHKNILSAESVREKYDRLVLQIKDQHANAKNNYKKGNGRQEVLPNWFDEDYVLPQKQLAKTEQKKTSEELDREVEEMKAILKAGRGN